MQACDTPDLRAGSNLVLKQGIMQPQSLLEGFAFCRACSRNSMIQHQKGSLQ